MGVMFKEKQMQSFTVILNRISKTNVFIKYNFYAEIDTRSPEFSFVHLKVDWSLRCFFFIFESALDIDMNLNT